MGSSVDGLVSGLSTSDLISKLMQAEAAPQQTMKTKVTAEQKVITAYQNVNTKVAALKTAADALTSTAGWKVSKVTSSSDTVVANASAGAPPGKVTFDVTTLAKAQVMTSIVQDGNPITTGNGLDINLAGSPDAIHVDVADDSPQGVVDAINATASAAGLNIKASLVQADQGSVLRIVSTQVGEAAAFTIDGFDPTATPTILTPGTNAKLTFGDPLHGGYSISSESNTFADLLPGVTFTASKEQQLGVTLEVKGDSAAIADKMQAMVDAANAAFAEISKSTAYDAASKQGGPLTADTTVRQVQQRLLGQVSQGATDYGSYKQLGIELDRTGKFTFDRTSFLAAYEANPDTVQTAISDSLATGLSEVAGAATDKTTGSLTTAIQGGNSLVTNLNTQIEDFNIRLEMRQSNLQRQFANLEVALGKMKDQSSWLAGQIAGLPHGG